MQNYAPLRATLLQCIGNSQKYSRQVKCYEQIWNTMLQLIGMGMTVLQTQANLPTKSCTSYNCGDFEALLQWCIRPYLRFSFFRITFNIQLIYKRIFKWIIINTYIMYIQMGNKGRGRSNWEKERESTQNTGRYDVERQHRFFGRNKYQSSRKSRLTSSAFV